MTKNIDTICIAGKNNIAVDVMLFCKSRYPKKRIIFVPNRTETGKNTWQKSARFFAEKNDIHIMQLVEVYKNEEMLFLSCEFDRIIEPEKFKSTALFNVHFSMLPKYKGCFTSVLPILNGEKMTGVTLHKIGRGIDTGEIIDQQAVEIMSDDTSYDLYFKLLSKGTEIVIRNIDRLIKNEYEKKAQETYNSTYYSRNYIDYSTLILNVDATAFQIRNQIRAFAFRPYQVLTWHNTAYVDSYITENISVHKPGTVIEDTEVLTRISSIDYDIVLYKDTFEKAIKQIQAGNDASNLCVSKKIIEAKDSHGWSLLTVAVYNNNYKMMRWLLEMGADVEVTNNNGTNLLMYAKECYLKTGDAKIFEDLAENKQLFYMEDYNGKNIYDYCYEERIKLIGKYDMTIEKWK